MTPILHTTAGLHPDSGGPARTITSLCAALSNIEKIEVSLLTQKHSNDSIYLGAMAEKPVQIAETQSRTILKSCIPLRRLLHQQIISAPPELIHDHGLWLPSNHYVARAAHSYGIPRVLNPRGMLEPWALSYRSFKKKAALIFYQNRDLELAKLFFATSEAEASNIRELGYKQPIAVIPNGVDLPNINNFTRLNKLNGRVKHALFMSRIHPVKGLMLLIQAWANVQPKGWRLILAGPDELGHSRQVMAFARKLGIDGAIEFVGSIEGAEKEASFEGASLFVLPSFSENFGVVVAEALAHGVPVITTRGTPWEGLLEHGCGWWVEPTSEALTAALREAINMDSESLRSMGEKGRKYAAEFDWKTIAQQTVEVYRWVLEQGSKPECVICA